MKILLLALTLTAGVVANSFAVDIVEDWTSAKSWAPTSGQQDAQKATSTESGIEYTFVGTYASGSYLFMQAKTYKDPMAYIEFSLPYECQEIIISLASGSSTNSAVAVFAGNELIQKNLALNDNGTDNSFKVTIPQNLRSVGTVYKIQSTTPKYNTQFATFTYVEATNDPVLEAEVAGMSFATIGLGSSQEQTLKLIADNFTGDVSVGVDNDAFEVPATVTPVEGFAEFTVKYTGSKSGDVTGKITLSGAGLTDEVELSAYTSQNSGTEEEPLSVEDVVKLNSTYSGPYYVTGIISNVCATGGSGSGLTTEDPFADENKNNVTSNIVLESEDGTYQIPVALPSDIQAKLNIYDNPDNRGLTIVVKGTLESYFSNPGVKNTEYVSGLPEVEPETVEDLAAVLEKADPNTPVYVQSEVTVIYVNGKYMYVTDGTTNLLFYNSSEDWAFNAGDKIPGGFKGNYAENGKAPEMTNLSDFGTAEAGDAPEPEVKTIDEITTADLYSYVSIKKVKLTVSGRNITFTTVADVPESRAGEEETAAATLAGYNTFGIANPEDLDVAYDVTGIVSSYNGNLQLLPTEYVASPTSGIEAIASDEAAAPAEYFNLQGQRVAEPKAGLYILRQGSKVSKVVVK